MGRVFAYSDYQASEKDRQRMLELGHQKVFQTLAMLLDEDAQDSLRTAFFLLHEGPVGVSGDRVGTVYSSEAGLWLILNPQTIIAKDWRVLRVEEFEGGMLNWEGSGVAPVLLEEGGVARQEFLFICIEILIAMIHTEFSGVSPS